MFTPMTLPFTFDALDPYISQKTMEEHYHIFYQGYIDNLNKATSPESPSYMHNLGGYLNHGDFWRSLVPPHGEPLHERYFPHAAAILQLAETSFGSGYIWVGKTGNIFFTPNQTRPTEETLLSLDLFEHAYIHDYANARSVYLRNLFNVLDWSKIDGVI